jgi:hypothetical protein
MHRQKEQKDIGIDIEEYGLNDTRVTAAFDSRMCLSSLYMHLQKDTCIGTEEHRDHDTRATAACDSGMCLRSLHRHRQ